MPEELVPYDKIVRSIVVQQLTQSGWIEAIRIPIENPEKASARDVQNTLEAVHDYIYKADKMYLSVQGSFMCMKRISESTQCTFRVCASYTPADEPFTVD